MGKKKKSSGIRWTVLRKWKEMQNVRQSLKMALIGFDQYNLIMCSWRIFPSFIFQVENRQRFFPFILPLDIINQTLNENKA